MSWLFPVILIALFLMFLALLSVNSRGYKAGYQAGYEEAKQLEAVLPEIPNDPDLTEEELELLGAVEVEINSKKGEHERFS